MVKEPKNSMIESDTLGKDSDPGTYDAKYLVAALLIFVAKGNDEISSPESDEMLRLLSDHFNLQSAESLGLLTRVMADIADNPDFDVLLQELSVLLAPPEKEEVAVMMLKIVAADGRRDVEEMDQFQQAATLIGVSSDGLHRAYDRYFAETQA